jgi:hypothetical protein
MAPNEEADKARAFTLGKPFQPSLIFDSKAGTFPSGAALRCRPEAFVKDKHSSLSDPTATDNKKTIFKKLSLLRIIRPC